MFRLKSRQEGTVHEYEIIGRRIKIIRELLFLYAAFPAAFINTNSARMSGALIKPSSAI